ncbi:helicase-related protein [Pseudarthrobacter enclensis]
MGLANRLLQELDTPDRIADGPTQLQSLHRPDLPKRRQLRRPTTKLSDSALLTNSKDDPNLAAELRTEIESANTVDLLCAFVRWTGLRLLQPALEEFSERGARHRVITTTYMGATERRAIDELVTRYGAEVKINYETQATRLHAKAWLFRRSSGFDTAYVGSSNLSQAALLDGLEWNVRLSSVETPTLLQKVFNRAGIASVAVDGSTDDADRAAALKRLAAREINCIFAVDLFNEGLDLPQVDTILMLRPTQSATIFLQQLGRGLRRAEGKAVLTVLDFIGQQRREFRFDLRYRALTGYGRKRAIDACAIRTKQMDGNTLARRQLNRIQDRVPTRLGD